MIPNGEQKIITGRVLSFTDDEEKMLHARLYAAASLARNHPPGWRAQLVKEVTAVNRIIHKAVQRGHS